jgi:hypothetical protein
MPLRLTSSENIENTERKLLELDALANPERDTEFLCLTERSTSTKALQ